MTTFRKRVVACPSPRPRFGTGRLNGRRGRVNGAPDARRRGREPPAVHPPDSVPGRGRVRQCGDERLTGYDFGPGHPLAPVRVELTIELARAFGVLDAPGVTVAAPAPATDGEIALVHDRRYIEAVRQASGPDPGPVAGRFGLGTDDDPIFPGMHDASALVAGA